jgi:hypothetical protein
MRHRFLSFLVLILSVVMLVSLAGCGSDDNNLDGGADGPPVDRSIWEGPTTNPVTDLPVHPDVGPDLGGGAEAGAPDAGADATEDAGGSAG